MIGTAFIRLKVLVFRSLLLTGKNIEQPLMKKVFNRHQLTALFGFCLVISFLFSPSLHAQEAATAEEAAQSEVAVAGEEGPCGPGDAAKGKQLFNC